MRVAERNRVRSGIHESSFHQARLLLPITHTWEWKLRVLCPEMILETWLLWTTYEWHMWLSTATTKTSASQKSLSVHIYHVLAHWGHTSAKSGSRMNCCNILFTAEDKVCLILGLCWVSEGTKSYKAPERVSAFLARQCKGIQANLLKCHKAQETSVCRIAFRYVIPDLEYTYRRTLLSTCNWSTSPFLNVPV